MALRVGTTRRSLSLDEAEVMYRDMRDMQSSGPPDNHFDSTVTKITAQMTLFPNSSQPAVASTSKSSIPSAMVLTPFSSVHTTLLPQNKKLPGLPSHLH